MCFGSEIIVSQFKSIAETEDKMHRGSYINLVASAEAIMCCGDFPLGSDIALVPLAL
jgi:hypothetical protein